MRFDLVHGIPFVEISLINKGKKLNLSSVLLDTGSASTVIPAEIVVELGLDSLPDDKVLKIHVTMSPDRGIQNYASCYSTTAHAKCTCSHA